MPLFSCHFCNYNTKTRYNFERHLKTKKHQERSKLYNNEGLCCEKKRKKKYKNSENSKMNKKEHKMNKKEHKMNTNEHKMNTNEPIMSQNEPIMSQYKIYSCRYCDKSFATKPSMRRHELHYCRKSNIESLELTIRKMEKEKETLYKQIDMLIEKAGDTTTNNNITNNIQINGFGYEDTSYITDKMLDGLLVYPGSMVPNLVALTHFHKDHPENKNLKITNIKSKYVKVYSNGKWILQNKDDVIDNIMNSNYVVLDEHYYDKGKNKLQKHKQKQIENFKNAIEKEEIDIVKNIKRDIELTIANNTE